MVLDTDELFTALSAQIARIKLVKHIGTISEISNNGLIIKGLERRAQLGDEVEVTAPDQPVVRAEITKIGHDCLTAVPFGRLEGLRIGLSVILCGPPSIAPGKRWLGRIIDPFGQPLDGRPLPPGARDLQLSQSPPAATRRRAMGQRLHTGLAVLDTMLPIASGQRVGLFAGSGVGKSTLIGKLTKQTSADINVIALIGERGRELRDFVEDVLGAEGLARSVIIAATSDMPAGVRRRALSLAMTVAEHYRDTGAHVLFLADSITRFAEAHREVAAASGEPITMQGFPASLTHALAQICERAGPGTEGQGDITAVLSVLVAGSDMEEPVADILRGLLDGHIVLSRKIAEQGRYPAIDVLRSVSRSLPEVAKAEENHLLQEARRILSVFDNSELMIQSGLYERGTDSAIDRAIQLKPEIDLFFQKTQQGSCEQSFQDLAAILEI